MEHFSIVARTENHTQCTHARITSLDALLIIWHSERRQFCCSSSLFEMGDPSRKHFRRRSLHLNALRRGRFRKMCLTNARPVASASRVSGAQNLRDNKSLQISILTHVLTHVLYYTQQKDVHLSSSAKGSCRALSETHYENAKYLLRNTYPTECSWCPP